MSYFLLFTPLFFTTILLCLIHTEEWMKKAGYC